MDEEEPGLRVRRQERRATGFAFSVVIWYKFGSREADDAALAARGRFDELWGDVGFVEVHAAVFTQGLTPVASAVASIAVKMAPALVIYDLRHLTLTRLFSKHLTDAPRLAKVLAVYRQCTWVDCVGNGEGTASVRDIICVRWDDQPAVLQLNTMAWAHGKRGPLMDSLTNHTIGQVFRWTPGLPVIAAAYTAKTGLVFPCDDLPHLCGVPADADEK